MPEYCRTTVVETTITADFGMTKLQFDLTAGYPEQCDVTRSAPYCRFARQQVYTVHVRVERSGI